MVDGPRHVGRLWSLSKVSVPGMKRNVNGVGLQYRPQSARVPLLTRFFPDQKIDASPWPNFIGGRYAVPIKAKYRTESGSGRDAVTFAGFANESRNKIFETRVACGFSFLPLSVPLTTSLLSRPLGRPTRLRCSFFARPRFTAIPRPLIRRYEIGSSERQKESKMNEEKGEAWAKRRIQSRGVGEERFGRLVLAVHVVESRIWEKGGGHRSSTGDALHLAAISLSKIKLIFLASCWLFSCFVYSSPIRSARPSGFFFLRCPSLLTLLPCLALFVFASPFPSHPPREPLLQTLIMDICRNRSLPR